jgi:hypothetical protein
MTKQPPKLAFDLEQDIRALSAMASNLTPYLYEQETYGHLSGNLPKLTLGGLLLRLHRLSKLNNLTSKQQSMVQDAHINFEAARSEWAVHYKTKLEQELETRIRSLEQYLAECSDNPLNCAINYPVEAEKRTMIEHLKSECAEHECLNEELATRITRADSRLERLISEGEFITDDRLQAVYPRSTFWWLYGYVPENQR